MNENTRRPNRHSNPSQYAKRNKHGGRYRFIRKKKSETKELLKAVLA